MRRAGPMLSLLLSLLWLCPAITACEALIAAPTETKAWTFDDQDHRFEGWNWSLGQPMQPPGATFTWIKGAGRSGSAVQLDIPFTSPDQIADFATSPQPSDLRGKIICASVEYTAPEAPDLSAFIAVYVISSGGNYVDTHAAPTGGWQVVCLDVEHPRDGMDSNLAANAITEIGVGFYAGNAPTMTTILFDDVAY